MLLYFWYGIAVLLGIVLLRRTRVVKDHEYNRAKAMRKMKHVYQAEERGVWETDAHLDSTFDDNTRLALGKSVSMLSSETPEQELDEDEKVTIEMLSEAEHVMKANARVSGEQSFDDERVNRTVGAHRVAGPMDRFLDGFFSIFGMDSRAVREEKRQNRLRQAASASPVIAQRPIAPLRINNIDDMSDEDMTTMTDNGGMKTVISSFGNERQSMGQDIEEVELKTYAPTLESMAMLTSPTSSQHSMMSSFPRCKACHAAVTVSDRYCPHCGSNIEA